MPIFKDSYQTTMGSIVATDNLERTLKQTLVSGNLSRQTLGVTKSDIYQPVFVLGLDPIEGDINLFTHPITVSSADTTKYIVSDLRMVTGGSLKSSDHYELDTSKSIEAHIRNKTEYRLLVARAILDKVWQADGVGRIKNDLDFAGVVFSTWISEAIGKSFALDLGDQHKLLILTHLYYQSLFMEGKEFTQQDKERLAIHTIKAARSNSGAVNSVLDQVSGFGSIVDYCTMVSQVTESIRLEKFSLATLVNVIGNSWYGVNAKDLLAVSLEHPPTWNSIVYTALNERTYRNSLIARVADRLGKRGVSDTYLKSFFTLMKDNSGVALESTEPVLEFNEFE